MMNLGVVLPEPGFLEAVRELTRRLGVLLIFDEVKTGLTIAAGGATERYGVTPDLVTLAKTLGGGLPSGAIGGSEEAFEVVESGAVYQVGTYNGNPLSMAAARASLEEVLTADAYRHLDALNDRLMASCQAVLDKYELPGYPVGVGAKGCVTFSTAKIIDYETFKANQDSDLSDLAWLYNMNRGIFATPGPRGGVDALGQPHLRRLRRLRRRLRGDGARPGRRKASQRPLARQGLRAVGNPRLTTNDGSREPLFRRAMRFSSPVERQSHRRHPWCRRARSRTDRVRSWSDPRSSLPRTCRFSPLVASVLVLRPRRTPWG